MNLNKSFIKEIQESKSNGKPCYWFIFRDNDLLVHRQENDRYSIPLVQVPAELNIGPIRRQFLGKYNGIGCYSAEVPQQTPPPPGTIFQHPWYLFNFIEHDFFQITLYAYQIVRWDQTNQYCGRCGSKTETMKNERAKICKKCKLISYPRISPAVIVGILKENKILLAKANRFKRDFYSILAGFVDAGETLEECIHREVKEEVNIEVENIRYFGSQPWPFPDSLMIGFFADYKSGEISCDGKEIVKAGWFSADNLPDIPGKISIAREMIDWFIDHFSS